MRGTAPWRRAGRGGRVGTRPGLIALISLLGLVATSPDWSGAAPASVGAQTGLVSHVPGGPTVAANGPSEGAVASADGRVIAFTSTATNLVSGQSDTNGATDVFVFDRGSGTVTLVSHAAGAPVTAANRASYFPSISADGSHVAFVSTATNLVGGQADSNNDADVFLFARTTGSLTLVSHTPGSRAATASGLSGSPVVSGDGSFVSFLSMAPNVVAGQNDANNHFDVFLFSRDSGTVTLVSHTPGAPTTTGALASQSQRMSADGGFVVFTSASPNLVAGQADANADSDAFLYERATGELRLVSHVPDGPARAGDASSSGYFGPSISADGGTIVFESRATNLVTSQVDINGGIDVFLFDRPTGWLTLVSHVPGSFATTLNGASYATSVSPEGGAVAFQSDATNAVAGQADGPGSYDVFLYLRGAPSLTLVSHAPTSPITAANALSTSPVVSANGAFVAYQSLASALVAGQRDGNGRTDVFLWRRVTDTTTLISHVAGDPTGAPAGVSSYGPALGVNSATVAYSSDAPNLVPGQTDGNGDSDVFVWARWGRAGGGLDFDGNGASEAAVFRPSDGTWWVGGGTSTTFGASGDVPVPLDYDGNGTTDVAVYRPHGNAWFVPGRPGRVWGAFGDVPVPGDYNGDGAGEVAVFRQRDGLWFVQGGLTVAFGAYGDIPVPADYDGDGATDFAVFRPASGMWFFSGASPAVPFGASGDIPAPGDYDGDGDAEPAVFRPSTGSWFIHGRPPVQFGTNGDLPMPGDYDGDGDTDVAVFRRSTRSWFIAGVPGFAFGAPGDIPLDLPSWISLYFGAIF